MIDLLHILVFLAVVLLLLLLFLLLTEYCNSHLYVYLHNMRDQDKHKRANTSILDDKKCWQKWRSDAKGKS
jgi:hypothetical protein